MLSLKEIEAILASEVADVSVTENGGSVIVASDMATATIFSDHLVTENGGIYEFNNKEELIDAFVEVNIIIDEFDFIDNVEIDEDLFTEYGEGGYQKNPPRSRKED